MFSALPYLLFTAVLLPHLPRVGAEPVQVVPATTRQIRGSFTFPFFLSIHDHALFPPPYLIISAVSTAAHIFCTSLKALYRSTMRCCFFACSTIVALYVARTCRTENCRSFLKYSCFVCCHFISHHKLNTQCLSHVVNVTSQRMQKETTEADKNPIHHCRDKVINTPL